MPHPAKSAVQQLITDARVPGLSMAVIDAGQPPALTVAGLRNARGHATVDQETIFAAASLSKPLFAYAVLQLVDAGELALDAPLSLHVPDYVPDDPRAASVTTRHVLSHSSGLPNWRSVDSPLKISFPPGGGFSYSGEGFVWLQRVVEIVTGESLDKTLRRLVFEPLEMHRSSYTWHPDFEANHADSHDAEGAPGPRIKPSAPNTAATLQTTGMDYARFLEAVLSGARLKPETADLWLKPQVHIPDSQIAWGLGWGLETGSGSFFQWGDYDQGRFKAFVMGSIRQRRAAVAFTNSFHGMAIMPALFGRELSGPHPAFAWLGYSALPNGV